MTTIEQLHLDAINSEVFVDYNGYDNPHVAGTNLAAIKAAKITEQIAIEFAEWLGNAEFLKLKSGNWTNNFGLSEYSGKTLFQEFLKTRQ